MVEEAPSPCQSGRKERIDPEQSSATTPRLGPHSGQALTLIGEEPIVEKRMVPRSAWRKVGHGAVVDGRKVSRRRGARLRWRGLRFSRTVIASRRCESRSPYVRGELLERSAGRAYIWGRRDAGIVLCPAPERQTAAVEVGRGSLVVRVGLRRSARARHRADDALGRARAGQAGARYPSDSGALSAATEAEYPVGDEVGLLVDDEVAGLGHQLEVERA
jgi:hypothetical protein